MWLKPEEQILCDLFKDPDAFGIRIAHELVSLHTDSHIFAHCGEAVALP
jgi:hypothetical protein